MLPPLHFSELSDPSDMLPQERPPSALADFAAGLRSLAPVCAGSERVSLTSRIQHQLARASALLAPLEEELSSVPDDKIAAFFDRVSSRGAQQESSGASSGVDRGHGEGGGDSDYNGYSSAQQFSSPEKPELDKMDSIARHAIQRIGCLKTLISEEGALCDDCGGSGPSVVDFCRMLSGDRLCSRCDISRHEFGR